MLILADVISAVPRFLQECSSLELSECRYRGRKVAGIFQYDSNEEA